MADSLRQEVDRIGAAYADSFNRQDAAGIAALYAEGRGVGGALTDGLSAVSGETAPLTRGRLHFRGAAVYQLFTKSDCGIQILRRPLVRW